MLSEPVGVLFWTKEVVDPMSKEETLQKNRERKLFFVAAKTSAFPKERESFMLILTIIQSTLHALRE